MKSYLLGIDIGTSACKVAVFDRNGKVLAAASGDYPVYYPQEGWAEQNPENGGMQSAMQQKKPYKRQISLQMRSQVLESMGRAGLR